MNLQSVIDRLKKIADILGGENGGRVYAEATELDNFINVLIDIKRSEMRMASDPNKQAEKLNSFANNLFRNAPDSLGGKIKYFAEELARGKRQAVAENNHAMNMWIDTFTDELDKASYDDSAFSSLKSHPKFREFEKNNFLSIYDLYNALI